MAANGTTFHHLLLSSSLDEIVNDNNLLTTLERDCFEYRIRYHFIFRLAAWGLIFCELFRRPCWTYHHQDWENRDRYPVSNLFFLHDGIIVLISIICLLLLGISLVLDAGYEVFHIKVKNSMGEFPSGEIQKLETSGAARWEYKLKTNPKGQMNRIIFFILSSVFLLKLVEILLHLFALMLSETQYQSFRSFPLSTFTPIEAIFLVLIEKQYRNLLIVIIRTLPRFLTLLFFLGIGVFLYTVLALRIFDPKSAEAEEYFSSIQEGFWSLITILNAADWPNPIIPAYEDSQLYFLFFFSFLIVGSWGLLNASSGLVFTFFRNQQQQIRNEITMAAFDHITRAYEILASDSLLRNETSPTNNIDGISIEIFKSILRAHSWRFNGIKGIRKPKFSSDPVFYQDRQNNQEVEFELDFNILLLVLWHKFKTCHNSELCSAQYENPFPLSNPKIWTDKWKEKFDVPADISLIDVSVVEDSSAVESIKKLIGGCSCYCGGPFTHSNIVGGRIPREMFIQFFLVTILREDSELFDLASVAIPQATRNSMLDTEFEDSKLSSFSMSLLDPTDSMNLDASPNKRNPILKRKSRRFFTAVTDVFQSPIVRPIYFNEGWRQCWLASRFLYREHPPEYIEFSKSKIFDIHWWKVLFERIIGSQEFDIITDALFATAMVIFIGFAPSVGLMIVWIIYALIETTLRLSFKGLRRVRRSMRDSSDAIITLLMVILLFIYFVSGDYVHDNSFSSIQHYSIPARYLSSDHRTFEVILFEGLLTLRGIFITRNIFVIPRMKKLRTRLKTAIRRCIQGASDVLFLILLLFAIGFVFAVLGTKGFGGLIQTDGDTTYPSISDSQYGKSDYYVLNFNDNISALGTLYVLLLVNNMHIIASGYTSISYDIPVKTFFVCWYIVGVLFLLNLLTASLLSSFLSFWVAQKKVIYETKVDDTRSSLIEAQDNNSQRSESESGESYHSHSHHKISEISYPPVHEERISTTRGRSQTVALNSMDDMFQWFHQGSTVWGGKNINIKESKPEPQIISSDILVDKSNLIYQSSPIHIPEQHQEELFPSAVRHTPMNIVTYYPFSNHPPINDNGSGDENSSNRNISNDTFLGETTLRLSTQFISSRKTHIERASKDVYLPEEVTSDVFKEKINENLRTKRTLAKQWKIWLTETHESITVAEYAALLLHSARRGRQRQMFFTLSAHESFKLRHRFGWIFLGAAWGLFLLSFFSRPSWTFDNKASKYQEQSIYPTANIPMISSIASALIALILICIISIGILLEIKYMSQHEVISSTIPSSSSSTTTTDHHNHHKRAPSRSLSKADGLFSDHGGGGSDYSDFIIHENPSRRTVSRRSLSSGSEGSIIQIGISDPHTNDDDNNDPQTSSNKRKTNWLQKFLQFFQRNFYQTNYFLSISTKRLFRILFLLINLMEISFILFYFITNKSIWSTTSTSSGTATSSNNGSNIPSQLERFSAWLSIIYIFWFDYHSASNVYLIMKSMKKFLIILILFFLFIVFCTCIGAYDYHLNNYSTDIHDDDGSGSSGSGGTSSGSDDMPLEDTSHSYFKTFSSSLWTIFTSISTTNFPNQLIPYYTQSRLLFLYFFLYLTIGNILFLNLILIIVIAEYNNSLQQNQQQKLLLRIYNLKLAFHILDVYHRGYLSYNQVYDLLHEVYHSYPEFRGTGYFTHQIPSSNELAVLIAALDINGNNCIYEEQFMWILHLTQIVIQEKVQGHYLEYLFPSILHHSSFSHIFNFIGSRKYCSYVDFLLLILSAICLVNDQSISSTNPFTDKIRITIAMVMLADLLVQFLILGPKRYFTLKWSIINLLLAIVMIIVSLYIITSSNSSHSDQLESAHICSSIICIIRVFLFIRNLDYLFSSIQVSLFFTTIQRIFISLTSLLVSFTCIIYLFALIGVISFGGLVNKDPDREQYHILQSTDYGINNYYSLNFNTIPSAIITLICLLRVSSWDTFAEAFEKLTHPIARIYFISWYLIGVLLLMNIVITLFISGFVVEAASQQQGQQEPTSTSHISPGTSSGGSGTSGIGGDNTSDEKKKSNLPPNSLTESLLSPIHSQIEKQYSSLQHLAQRLTQFMSPTYGNGNDNNYRQSIPQQDQSSIDENHSLSYRPPSPTPTPTTTTTTPTSAVNNPIWNPDISRLTKGSAIRDITTAREGGKLYMISMPKYVTSGAGSMSIDNIGDDESEVNQKFLKRIHSLYTEEK